MSLIDPEVLKTIASKALHLRSGPADRALADDQPGAQCAGGGAGSAVTCPRPAEFTVTSREGERNEYCRDHLLAFAQAETSAKPRLLTASPPPQR